MTARTDPTVQEFARRLLPINRGAWVLDRTRATLAQGSVRLGAHETSSLAPDRLWADTGDRGRGRHAHGFTFFADWVGASAVAAPEEQPSISELVVRTVAAWDERFGADRAGAPEMAYHDETTAQRLLGVTAALGVLTLDESQRALLTDVAARTAAVLADPEFHSGLNNHGMFQDLALLAWSVLVPSADDALASSAWDAAGVRLDAYFQSCFTAEGVHIENTPTYHLMIARYLPILAGIYRATGAGSAPLYEALLAGAERYAVHAVAPDGLYPPVSDTQRRPIDSAMNLVTFDGGEFEFAATRGARGRAPAERSVGFPTSGYAMTRSAWGDTEATFAYFSCAYNADYHKHSDELSVFLRSGGRDLLCEAGAYGYNWKDPFTKYAYSSNAHNTMLVDGAGLPRTEPSEVRAHAPEPIDELRVDSATDDLLDATGTTRRYPGRIWRRRLVVTHGTAPSDSVLRVDDEVRSADGAANLRFLWHLGPGLSVVLRPRGAEVFDGEVKVMEIDIRTAADVVLGVVEGVGGSSPQGWYHPALGEKVPAPVLTVDCWQADVALETVFRLSGFVWGADDAAEGRSSLRPLVEAGAAVPAWRSSASEGSRAVVLLAPHEIPADRDRLTTELEKGGIPHWFVPGACADVAAAATPDLAIAALERVSDAVAALVRRERRRGVEVVIGAISDAFAPAVAAALRTGAALVGLDPALPAAGAHAQRLALHLSILAATGEPTSVRVLVTHEARGAADDALRPLEAASVERRELRHLLAADAEDGFSDVLRNTLAVAQGTEPPYLAGYDRRGRAFVLELPDQDDVVVAARVFHGKTEVASMPYTAGSSHRLPHDGRGPHRLRVHVRNAEGEERFAFTTGVVRVR